MPGPLSCALWALLQALAAPWAGWDSPPFNPDAPVAVVRPGPAEAAAEDTMSATAVAAVAASGAPAGRFLYFAYGSNLLAERLHINNPSAQRVAPARLDDFRLDFGFMSPRWGGHAATVVPQPGRNVWGAVWSLADEHLDDLDRQEGVQTGVYVPLQVQVHTLDGHALKCRSYHLREQPPSPLADGLVITEGRLPSKIYWQVIVQGARETGLPASYIDFLEKIPHNDFVGNFTIGSLATNLEEINIPLNVQ